MSEQELKAEGNYRYQERLGILCGDSKPTEQERAIALEEANRAMEELRQNEPG